MKTADDGRAGGRAVSDHDLASLQTLLAAWGEKPSHARGLLRSFYARGGSVDWEQVTAGRRLRARFEAELPQRQSQIVRRHVSTDGTTKLLVGLNGGGSVETVLMPGYRPDRAAGCVSSQIGCAMGCDFCASTKGGLERNLSAGEIVEQFLHLRAEAIDLGRRLLSLVFMGMGEPMHNLEAVMDAIRRISHPDLGGQGGRHNTVSTVGIVPGIDRLAEAGLNVHLALSLHAPDDATRAALVPMNRRYRIAEIIAATRRFWQRTRRIPTIEYCLLAGVNDSEAQARELAGLVEGFKAHVNIIPYNPIGTGLSGRAYQRPGEERVIRFLTALRDAGAVAHRRDTRGDDVNAACGQLRHQDQALTVLGIDV
jgi:23S rRNA (adenine2503-C2)-methyltransferase